MNQAGCPTIPPDWAGAVRAALDGSRHRVILLGPRDAGKSTFAQILLEAAADHGIPATILDADVGQKTVGPPACVTLGILHSSIGPESGSGFGRHPMLQQEERAAHALIPPERPTLSRTPALLGLAFAGETDPVRGSRGVVAGIERLGREAPEGLLAISTSGLLGGPGRRLKAAKFAALRPDLIVALGTDPDLDAVLADYAGIPTIRLASSPLARRKTVAWRRSARRAAFRAYFATAEERTASLAEVAPGDDALPLRGTLLGLSDEHGRDVALGVVTEADPAAGTLAYRAPPALAPVAGIRTSALVLDEDFSERRRRDGLA